MSIKKKELKKRIRSIHKKDRIISSYKYDFKRKHSSKSKISINHKVDNKFIIVEGIFAHRLDFNYHITINIVCNEEKEICYKRRLERDQFERGREVLEVNKKFNKSWYLFNKSVKNYLENYNVIHINPVDNDSYNKLVYNLKNN